MAKYLFSFLIIVFCFSCTKKDVSSPKNNHNKTSLKFESIRYTIEDGDGIKQDTIPFKSLTVANKTSVRQATIFHPDMKEYSLFKNDSASFEDLTRDSAEVIVPHDVLPTGSIIFNKSTALLCDTLVAKPASYTVKDSLFVQPDTEMTFNAKLINKVITTTYYATFADSITEAEYVIRGKWTGTIPLSVQSEVRYDNIK